MKKRHITVLAALISVATYNLSAIELSDNSGKVFSGDIVSLVDGNIALEGANGTETLVKVADLKADAQAAVSAWAQRNPDKVDVYKSVDVQPVPTHTVMPKLSPDARARGLTGLVSVAAVIDENGNVSSPRVLKASYDELAEPAIAALSNWKFQPAQKNGRAVKVRIVIPFRFN